MTKKSLALKEEWQSYQGLGWSLYDMNKYQSAVDAFKKSLSLKETWKSYEGLGRALYKLENVERGIKIAQLGYRRTRPPHSKIDPFLGEKHKVTVTRDLIENIAENLSKIQFAFHPSYFLEAKECELLQSWENLIHIHIPKCAGTNFERPLEQLPYHLRNHLKKNGQTLRADPTYRHYLWHGNLGEKCIHDAFIAEAFHGDKMNNIQGSFIATHGAKHGIYSRKLSEAGSDARKICLVRDPSERLYSHIRHHGRTIYSKRDLLNYSIKDCQNVMDRYIYDYDLFEGQNENPYCQPTDYEYCESIDFLDISDDLLISRVKSSFLSATLMPNIVQYNRLNDGNGKYRTIDALDEKDFKDVHRELILRGFLERDNQIDLDFLKKKTIERLVFPDVIYKGVELHPITFIFPSPSTGVPRLMYTKDFIADPLGSIK